MPGWGDRTSRRRHKIGFKHALQRHPAVRVMFCLPIQSPSTFPAVTWRFIGGRMKASAASIPNTTKLETMSIFAGESNKPGGSLVSVRQQSSGTIDVLHFALF